MFSWEFVWDFLSKIWFGNLVDHFLFFSFVVWDVAREWLYMQNCNVKRVLVCWGWLHCVRVRVWKCVGLGDSVWVWWCACITKRWIVVIMEAASHTHKFYSWGHTFCIISTSQNWILILNSQIFIIALPSPNLSLLLFTANFCLFIPLLPFGSSVQVFCIFSFLFKIINSCYLSLY